MKERKKEASGPKYS